VPPQAAVQTEAPGLVAEQVELLVTLPIEQAISGASGVQAVRSETISGLSVVTVVFQENVDPYRARQIVAEALGQVTSRLPLGVKPPKLEPLTSSTMDLLKLGFVSERLSPMQLRDLVQWTIRPRLLAVPGLPGNALRGRRAAAAGAGGAARAERARPGFQRHRGGGAFRDRGARRGFHRNRNQRVLIESRGQTLDAAALGAAVVPALAAAPAASAAAATAATPLRLRDFATVTDGVAPKFGDALIMGKPGVLLNLSSQYGANTLIVTRAIEAALAELAPALRSRGVTLYAGCTGRPTSSRMRSQASGWTSCWARC